MIKYMACFWEDYMIEKINVLEEVSFGDDIMLIRVINKKKSIIPKSTKEYIVCDTVGEAKKHILEKINKIITDHKNVINHLTEEIEFFSKRAEYIKSLKIEEAGKDD